MKNLFSKKEKLNAIVIGAGSIGALKPDKYDSPKTKNILTHAHAFYSHPEINLVGIVDTDKAKAEAAARKWKTKAFTQISEISESVQIAAVCTPTETHVDAIYEASNLKDLKVIIAEKPFTQNLTDAQYLLEYSKYKGFSFALDYIRRFDVGMNVLKDMIEKNTFGTVFNSTLRYTRGLKHEACHAIDLMRYLFGECISSKILNKEQFVEDRDPDDPTYLAYFQFQKCPHAIFLPCDGREYAVFEWEIYTSKGKISITDHGLRVSVFRLIPEKTYGNYLQLDSREPIHFKTELSQAMFYLVQNCVQFIKGKEDLICTAEDAIAVHKIYLDMNI